MYDCMGALEATAAYLDMDDPVRLMPVLVLCLLLDNLSFHEWLHHGDCVRGAAGYTMIVTEHCRQIGLAAWVPWSASHYWIATPGAAPAATEWWSSATALSKWCIAPVLRHGAPFPTPAITQWCCNEPSSCDGAIRLIGAASRTALAGASHAPAPQQWIAAPHPAPALVHRNPLHGQAVFGTGQQFW